MDFKSTLLPGLVSLGGIACAQQVQAQTGEPRKTATHNLAAYYALSHTSREGIEGGVVAGAVMNMRDGAMSAEANVYMFYRLTGDRAPVKVDIGASAGTVVSARESLIKLHPMLRLGTNIPERKTAAFINNFYVAPGLPIANDLRGLAEPAVTFGCNIPFGTFTKPANKQALRLEVQRWTP